MEPDRTRPLGCWHGIDDRGKGLVGRGVVRPQAIRSFGLRDRADRRALLGVRRRHLPSDVLAPSLNGARGRSSAHSPGAETLARPIASRIRRNKLLTVLRELTEVSYEGLRPSPLQQPCNIAARVPFSSGATPRFKPLCAEWAAVGLEPAFRGADTSNPVFAS